MPTITDHAIATPEKPAFIMGSSVPVAVDRLREVALGGHVEAHRLGDLGGEAGAQPLGPLDLARRGGRGTRPGARGGRGLGPRAYGRGRKSAGPGKRVGLGGRQVV